MSRMDQLHELQAADPGDADVLYMLAQEHAKAGNHTEAQRWYDRCIEADPGYLYAYFHKARSQQASEEEEPALQTLRAGLIRAKALGDAKAVGEMMSLIDEMGG